MTQMPGETLPAPPAEKQTDNTNLIQRVRTGLLLLPIVIIVTYLGGWAFVAGVAVVAVVGVLEFCALGVKRDIEGSGLVAIPAAILIVLAFHLNQPPLWQAALVGSVLGVLLLETFRGQHNPKRRLVKVCTTLAALFYVAFPAAFMVAVRDMNQGLVLLMLIFLITWGTDTAAYLGGRLWGKTKFAPTISPKKTLEGAITGVVGGILPAAILLGLSGLWSTTALVPIAVGPLLAILGDLLESGVKRAFQVKDSHILGFDILPGHGGVLDRVDSLIVVTVFCYLYFLMTGLTA
jgi:phosphatidate cytidylyltransferase